MERFAYEIFFVRGAEKFYFLETKKPMLKLLNELYNRDSRKTFTNSNDFWMMSSLDDTKNFIKEMPYIFSFDDRLKVLSNEIQSD